MALALLGVALGCALWAKYFVVVLAAPYALFLLFDKTARQSLSRPAPGLPLRSRFDRVTACDLALRERFPAVCLCELSRRSGARLVRSYPASGGLRREPAVFHAAGPVHRRSPVHPASASRRTGSAESFDRRIATVLAFGPGLTMIALTAASGRGTFAMWGYPLWLFVGLWLVMAASQKPARPAALAGLSLSWAAVFTVLVVVFVANYAVMPRFDHRYRAVFFPGDALGRDLTGASTPRPESRSAMSSARCGTAAISRTIRPTSHRC